MIKIEDIRVSLVKILSSNFQNINIVTEDINQIKQNDSSFLFPFIHIQIELLKSKIFDIDTRDESILVDLTYMEDTISKNKSMYNFIDEVKIIFDTGFYVKDRFLKINSIDTTIAEDILHIVFMIEFNNGTVDKAQEEEKIFNLNLRRI